MKIVRLHLFLTLALGVIASGLGTSSVFAHEGHDHEAMKAEKSISTALATLSAADRKQAEEQRFCPMMAYSRLGAMGPPIKLTVEGKPVFVCCKECIDHAVEGGQETLKTAQKLAEASAVLAKLSPPERVAAEAQKYCAIQSKNFLGSMGAPAKLDFDGKPVYLCCKGCAAKARANPAATLAKVEELKKAGKAKGHDHGDHKH